MTLNGAMSGCTDLTVKEMQLMSVTKYFWVLAMVVAVMVVVPVQAATVTLTASDGFNASSFNSAGNWDSGAAPSAGNDYVVANDLRLRTPPDGNSHTFAGDSLTINPDPADDILGLSYKGTGNTGSITIDNLILNGGSINHINGSGDVFNLYGNINVVADSVMRAKQGPINVYSAISGTAQIAIHPSDVLGNELTFLSSANTFTGDIVNTGRFTLADDANMNFVIGASGVSNSISGADIHSIFEGDFVLDLSGASTAVGDSWAIDATTPASTYYTSTFTVVGFTPLNDTVWRKQIGASSSYYKFDESNGLLSVVPEPASLVLLVIGLALTARCRRRQQ